MPYAVNARDASRVYFEDDLGDGAPVVLLGGFLDPVELVREAPIARSLAERADEFRLVVVDHRGHGLSDRPHDPSAYAMELRAAVVAVVDELEIDRAHVVGISWGGRLGFGLVEHAAERVRSLTAIGQHPFAIDPSGPLAWLVGEALGSADERGIEPLVQAFESIVGRYPESVRAIYLASDALAMRAAWRAAMDEGAVSEHLASWRVPCLVCVAEDDRDFFEPARRAAEAIPTASFVVIPRTDHLGVDSASAEPVLPAVLRLLRAS